MPSPPNVLYSDNFTGYPIGSFPTGWAPFSGATVQHDPLGFYSRVVQHFASSHIYKDLTHFYTDVTVFFAFSPQGIFGFDPFILGFENAVPLEANGSQYLSSVSIESDMTLSCRGGVGGALIGNSAPYTISSGWNYAQVNASFFTVPDIHGNNIVWATMGICLNGRTVISSNSASTGINVVTLYNPIPAFNYWVINSPVGFAAGLTANVYLCTLTELTNDPFSYTGSTYTGSKATARASQCFIEAAVQPIVTNARASQAFIEVAELPTSMNVRASQNFIELITLGTSKTSTWDVKES